MKKNRYGASLSTEMHRRSNAKSAVPEVHTATWMEMQLQKEFEAGIKELSSWSFVSRSDVTKLIHGFDERQRIYPGQDDVVLVKEAAILHDVAWRISDPEIWPSTHEDVINVLHDLQLALYLGRPTKAALVRERLASLVEKMRATVEEAELGLVATLVEQGDDAFWASLQAYHLGKRGPQLKKMIRERVSPTELYTIADVEAWIDRRSAVEAELKQLDGFHSFYASRAVLFRARKRLERQEREFWERDSLARRIPKAQALLKAVRRL